IIENFDKAYSTEWNKLLSPGEQQKLAFARLFFRRPVFAILDEATCSMDNMSENEMFKQCRLMNITCITVSHHLHLDRFHHQKITIGGRGTWSWSEVTNTEEDDDDEFLDRGDS
ncbi:ATP-binding cassette sub- D member 3, partial [Modicella reniformis]